MISEIILMIWLVATTYPPQLISFLQNDPFPDMIKHIHQKGGMMMDKLIPRIISQSLGNSYKSYAETSTNMQCFKNTH